MVKTFHCIALTLFFLHGICAQGKPHTSATTNPCLTDLQWELYRQFIIYRAAHGLDSVPLSASLSNVAQTHCIDLATNQPHTSKNCNLHSWSGKGGWRACCYTPDHRQAACMWDKPREMTKYQGDGYEIAFYSNYPFENAWQFAAEAIRSWGRSAGHNSLMLNKNKWKSLTWRSVGVGVFRGYASIWFGTEIDPDNTLLQPCNSNQ